jgi:hypothetical protein
MTETTFALCLRLCNMSQAEAALFFDVRLDTIKSWSSGRNAAPVDVYRMLAGLWSQIEAAADNVADGLHVDLMDRRQMLNISADIIGDELPNEAARNMAGALALLMALNDEADGDMPA